jgi:hypothetical protein
MEDLTDQGCQKPTDGESKEGGAVR